MPFHPMESAPVDGRWVWLLVGDHFATVQVRARWAADKAGWFDVREARVTRPLSGWREAL